MWSAHRKRLGGCNLYVVDQPAKTTLVGGSET